MKSLLFCALLAGVAAITVYAGTCQQDFDACKVPYKRDMPNMHDPTGICNLGNNFISCLRNLTGRSDCSVNQTASINNERRKTEDMLQRNVTGCTLCLPEVEKCKTQFDHDAAHAGSGNIELVCKDGQAFILCLRTVHKSPYCVSEKGHIDQERRKAETKLRDAGCDTGHSCLLGIETCENAEKAAAANGTLNHQQQCTVASTFYTCLSQQTCTGEYLKSLKQAMDQLVSEQQAANCTVNPGGNGGGGASHTTFSVAVIATSVLAVIALLK